MNLADQYDRLAEQKMTEAARAMEMAEREREVEAKFGQDDWPDETVLHFNHQFGGCGTRYTYVAFKIKGGWYIGGKEGARWTWDTLVSFMQGTTELWSVDTWKKEF